MKSESNTEFKVDHINRRADVTWTGIFDMDAIADSCRRRLAEGAHRYAQLIDAEGARIAESERDVRNLPRRVELLADESERFGVAGPTAVVVAREVDFGMCRMIAAYFDPAGKIAVFYTHEEAKDWLALHPADS